MDALKISALGRVKVKILVPGISDSRHLDMQVKIYTHGQVDGAI
jgi:hypothetical protein